jgi:glycerophosphoryl diester phosphodiesterase
MKLLFMIYLTLFTATLNAQQKTNAWHKNPLIAHRGAWKTAGLPQNSIASLKQAIKLNCYGTEFDVQLTKDNVIVVNHDDDFLGMPIATSAYQQLLEKKLPNGEAIPTLESYLMEGLKQFKTKLILEIKPQKQGEERDLLLAQMAMDKVNLLNASTWMEYISFSYPICQYLVNAAPKAMVYYLGGDKAPNELKSDGIGGADYHYSVFKKNPTWLAGLKKQGLQSNAWTVNKKEDIDDLLAQKIDFLTSNEPELVFERMEKLEKEKAR